MEQSDERDSADSSGPDLVRHCIERQHKRRTTFDFSLTVISLITLFF
jgi:hypothetical protein